MSRGPESTALISATTSWGLGFAPPRRPSGVGLRLMPGIIAPVDLEAKCPELRPGSRAFPGTGTTHHALELAPSAAFPAFTGRASVDFGRDTESLFPKEFEHAVFKGIHLLSRCTGVFGVAIEGEKGPRRRHSARDWRPGLHGIERTNPDTRETPV